MPAMPPQRRQQVLDAVDWAYANKLQIITHSNGEAASDLLIAAIRDGAGEAWKAADAARF